MTLRLRAWKDSDVSVRLYVSTSGDFVQLGTRTDYPFVAGGPNGVPQGWTAWTSGTDFNNVSFSVGEGRFNISNAAPPTIKFNWYYAATRRFPIVYGNRYVISAQAQTMQGKAVANRYMHILLHPGDVSYFSSAAVSASSWEDVTLWTNTINATYTEFEVKMGAIYGDPATGPAFTDPNWGVQWQGVSILEQASSYPDPTWQEITCDARSVQTRYGRDKFTSRYDVGSFSIGIRNDDGEFTYDENHPWGLRPGRFIRGEIERAGVKRPLFYGIIDGLTDGYSLDGHAITVVNCFDISTLLSGMNVATSSAPSWTYKSGTRIKNLYTQSGWHPSMSYTETGKFDQQAILANGRSIRDEIALGADSEGSYWFADRDGKLKYYDRDWPIWSSRQTAVQADITAMDFEGSLPVIDEYPTAAGAPQVCPQVLNTDWSRDRIINELQLANQGGVARSYRDDSSQKKYGVATYQRLDFLNINGMPSYLDTRANDIMTGFGEAILRVNSVQFRPTPEIYDWAATVFLNDVVRVWYVHPINLWGFAVVTHVQSVQHSITPNDWVMTLSLDQPLSFVRFIWDPLAWIHGWDGGKWDENLWDQGSQSFGVWTYGYLWSDPASKWGT